MSRWMTPARRAGAFVAIAVLLAFIILIPSVGIAAQQGALTGTLTTRMLDPMPGSNARHAMYYILTEDSGKTTELLIPDNVLQAAGGLDRLDRQRITVSGVPTTQANTAPTLTVQTISLVAATASTPKRQVVGGQPFLNVLCKFNDLSTTEPKGLAYFADLMGNGPGGLGDFFSQASYGNINLNDTLTAGPWSTLPKTILQYIPGGGNPTNTDLDNLAKDCAATIPPTVVMDNVKGLNFMFNGPLGNVAVGGSGTRITINGRNDFWSSTWMPPWGYFPEQGNMSVGQTVLAHEMGHAFGLPHSAGPTGVTYGNSWDVMSETYNFCGNPGATDAIYGCLGQHMNGYHKDRSEWIAPARKFTYAGVGQTLTFNALADPAASANIYYAVIPHTGTATQFTTVEFRRPIGYDVKLPGTGVIIHEVDTTRRDPSWVVGTDGGAGAIRAVGSVYTAPNSGGVTVTVNSIGATSASVTIGTVAVLQSVTVTPNMSGIQIGSTVQMTATGNYSNGTTQNLTGTVTWALAAGGPVTISAGGLVTGVAVGGVTVTATSGAIVGTATVNVIAPPLPGARANGGPGGGPINPLPVVRGGTGGGNPVPLPSQR